ncbi:hypothetical protein [Xylella taiwanensis]|uniref:Uncharacterized protein n=1 Tax=Xylella taiwanensis TaxID=1444770 RepID=Z9JLR0_9GAMM|nr:hypothetical protein [Xylella taiwanensis]EWS78918.1 hypothetical protein AF72_03020 [Xylella taiwanensis]
MIAESLLRRHGGHIVVFNAIEHITVRGQVNRHFTGNVEYANGS